MDDRLLCINAGDYDGEGVSDMGRRIQENHITTPYASRPVTVRARGVMPLGTDR